MLLYDKAGGKVNPELANIYIFLLSESLAMSSLFRNNTEKNRIIGSLWTQNFKEFLIVFVIR